MLIATCLVSSTEKAHKRTNQPPPSQVHRHVNECLRVWPHVITILRLLFFITHLSGEGLHELLPRPHAPKKLYRSP